jgi:glycosidase
MVWDDLTYEPEVTHPLGGTRRANRVEPDASLRETYQRLIELRKDHLRLFVDGDLTWLAADDANGVLAYQRALGEEKAIVLFNRAEDVMNVTVPADAGTWVEAWPGDREQQVGDSLTVQVLPLRASVWLRVGD